MWRIKSGRVNKTHDTISFFFSPHIIDCRMESDSKKAPSIKLQLCYLAFGTKGLLFILSPHFVATHHNTLDKWLQKISSLWHASVCALSTTYLSGCFGHTTNQLRPFLSWCTVAMSPLILPTMSCGLGGFS